MHGLETSDAVTKDMPHMNNSSFTIINPKYQPLYAGG